MPNQGVQQIITSKIKFQLWKDLTTWNTDLLQDLHCSVILLLHLGSPTSVPQTAPGSQRSPAAGIQHSQVLHVTFWSELLPDASAAAEVSSSAVRSSIPPCWVSCLVGFYLTSSTATYPGILSSNLLPVIF